MAQVTIKQADRISRICQEYTAEEEAFWSLPVDQRPYRGNWEDTPHVKQFEALDYDKSVAAILLLASRDRVANARAIAHAIREHHGEEVTAELFDALLDEIERRATSTPAPVTAVTAKAPATAKVTRTCNYCGEPFTAARSDARYCSGKHRVYALRARKRAAR
jgi:hypothetical protein